MNDARARQQISPLIEKLLPDAAPTEKLEAQANLDHFVSVLYRTSVRMASEARSVESDKVMEDAILNTSTKIT